MERTKIIEAYLDGSLDKGARDELETRALKDKQLSELIRLHKEVNDSIRDTDLHELRIKLLEISADMSLGDEKPLPSQEHAAGTFRKILPRKQLMRIAASLAILLAVSAMIKVVFFRNLSGPMIFKQYYVRYEPDVINRSSGTNRSDMDDALLQYESGNYARCSLILKNITDREQDNYLAMFYLGLTYLELQKPAVAVTVLSAIPQAWESPYAVHREWYLALSLINAERKNEALPLLKHMAATGGFYSAKAKAILRELRF
jgi:hypothetical protein